MRAKNQRSNTIQVREGGNLQYIIAGKIIRIKGSQKISSLIFLEMLKILLVLNLLLRH